MKVAHINYSDIGGGAGRAAYRIHHALRRHGINSRMYVASASAGDWTVETPTGAWLSKIDRLRPFLGTFLASVLCMDSQSRFLPAILPSRWPKLLNSLDTDVTHLHWVAREMMSIADIGRLRGPVVWTLHDMWAFAGSEHFTEDFRWRDGYSRHNRPANESGFDFNRWVWRRKKKHWRHPMHIVAPSLWLADCARQSTIMHDWCVSVIPNAIDTEVWRPIDKTLARRLLQLPSEVPLLLFGAQGGTRDPRKGFDLLKGALDQLRNEIPGLELLVLGQSPPKEPLDLGFPVHFAGHLHDDVSLCLHYSAADAAVVPSRQESFSNVCAEAHACGTPAVVFNANSLGNIVEHEKTGYLAKPFDTQDLARGIRWVIADAGRHAVLSAQSRQAAVAKFSYPVVAEQYLQLYEKVCRT
jgi:glycosyltransferase involved in cell wall biosynthesis